MVVVLSRFIWRGGVSVAIAALTAVCIAWLLSVVSKHSEAGKRTFTDASQKVWCQPSHCRQKPGR